MPSTPSSEPGFFRKVQHFLKRFGDKASWYLTVAIFAVLWVLVFAPMAIIGKLTGKKFLPRFTGKESTYFMPKEPVEPTLARMRKQW